MKERSIQRETANQKHLLLRKNNGNPHFLYEDTLKTGLRMLNPCFIKIVERFLTAYIWVNLIKTKLFL